MCCGKCAGLLYGLLLPAIMAGFSTLVLRPHQEPEPEHKDAGAHLAAGYVLLQRQALVRSHHHRAQQATENHTARRHPLLYEVQPIMFGSVPNRMSQKYAGKVFLLFRTVNFRTPTSNVYIIRINNNITKYFIVAHFRGRLAGEVVSVNLVEPLV